MSRVSDPHIENKNQRFAMIPESILGIAPDVGPSAFLVYATLVWMSGQRRSCFPSVATIAKKTGMSARTVGTAINRLEELGLIERHHREDADGGQSSNQYVITNADVAHPPAKNDVPPTANIADELNTSLTISPTGSESEHYDDHVVKPWSIWSWYSERVGLKTRPGGRAMSAAKRLVAYGVTTDDDLNALYDWLKADPFWASKGIDLSIMASQYEKFKSVQSPELKRHAPWLPPGVKDV